MVNIMKKDYKQLPLVVQLAEEILAMHSKVIRLQDEVEELAEYRDKYVESLDTGIKHGERMLNGLLSIALVPGVMDAIASNKEKS